jgi:multidrug efflux system outer membrane protein
MTAFGGAALLLLSACQLAPSQQQPALPTAAEWPTEYAGDTEYGTRPAELGWRQVFVDQRLTALIDAALQHNRDLAVSVAQIEEARGLYRIQRSERLPTIAVSAEAGRSRVGSASALASGGTLPAGTDAVTTERYSLGVGITAFELDFWGRVRNLSEAARSQYLATVEAARAFKLSLIRQVAVAYLDSLAANEQIDLAEGTVRTRQEGLRIAQRRLDAGVTSALDFRQAETLLTQAQTELASLRLSRAQSNNLLTALLGTSVQDSLPEPMPISLQAAMAEFAADVPSRVLTNRPDILAAEEQLRAARANIGAARAAFFPSITLTGSAGYASIDLDNLVGKNGQTWSFGPSLTVPIFDFGRRRGNLDTARAREKIALANYEGAIQRGFQEVADALAGRQYLAEQAEAQKRGVLAQRRLAELARTRYREGVVRYIEVLDAERTLFSAEQALLQVHRAQAENLVELYVALGGGVIE